MKSSSARGHAGEDAVALDVGPEAAEAGAHRLAGVGVDADLARQRQQPHRVGEVEVRGVGAAAEADALGLVLGVVVAELQVGSEGAGARVDVLAGLGVTTDRLLGPLPLGHEVERLLRASARR